MGVAPAILRMLSTLAAAKQTMYLYQELARAGAAFKALYTTVLHQEELKSCPLYYYNAQRRVEDTFLKR